MTQVLITGFEPFNGAETNPSQTLARAMDGLTLGPVTVVGRVLPVEFGSVATLIDALLTEIRPVAVIATGLAESDTAIRLEWFASNRMESMTADNVGVTPLAQPIDLDGPAVRQSTIDLKAVGARLKAAKIPMRLSYRAGSHCCNLLLYSMLGAIEARGWSTQAAFIHLPPESAMPLEKMIEAVTIAIQTMDL